MNVRCASPEIVEVANTISIFVGYHFSIIDRCTAGCIVIIYLTIEHTVHNHGLEICAGIRGIGSGSYIIVSHNTTYCVSCRNLGIAEAVDDTGFTVKETDKTSYIVTLTIAHSTAAIISYLRITVFICCNCAVTSQYTTVVDSGSTFSYIGNGTSCFFCVYSSGTTDIHIIQHHILHRTTINGAEQCMSLPCNLG